MSKINFEEPEKSRHKIAFDNLTPLYPNSQLIMESEKNKTEKNPDLTPRLIDLSKSNWKRSKIFNYISTKSWKNNDFAEYCKRYYSKSSRVLSNGLAY